ncbi:hypothetical protein HC928_00640 [bacterium]|nr:hypothetical protein [bacterium]
MDRIAQYLTMKGIPLTHENYSRVFDATPMDNIEAWLAHAGMMPDTQQPAPVQEGSPNTRMNVEDAIMSSIPGLDEGTAQPAQSTQPVRAPQRAQSTQPAPMDETALAMQPRPPRAPQPPISATQPAHPAPTDIPNIPPEGAAPQGLPTEQGFPMSGMGAAAGIGGGGLAAMMLLRALTRRNLKFGATPPPIRPALPPRTPLEGEFMGRTLLPGNSQGTSGATELGDAALDSLMARLARTDPVAPTTPTTTPTPTSTTPAARGNSAATPSLAATQHALAVPPTTPAAPSLIESLTTPPSAPTKKPREKKPRGKKAATTAPKTSETDPATAPIDQNDVLYPKAPITLSPTSPEGMKAQGRSSENALTIEEQAAKLTPKERVDFLHERARQAGVTVREYVAALRRGEVLPIVKRDSGVRTQADRPRGSRSEDPYAETDLAQEAGKPNLVVGPNRADTSIATKTKPGRGRPKGSASNNVMNMVEPRKPKPPATATAPATKGPRGKGSQKKTMKEQLETVKPKVAKAEDEATRPISTTEVVNEAPTSPRSNPSITREILPGELWTAMSHGGRKYQAIMHVAGQYGYTGTLKETHDRLMRDPRAMREIMDILQSDDMTKALR